MSDVVRKMRRQIKARASQLRELLSGLSFELLKVLSVALIFPIVAPALGPGGYGEYTTLYVLAGLATTWASAAAGAAIIQLILQQNRTVDSVIGFGRRQLYLYAIPLSVVGVGASLALFGTDILAPALLVFGSDLILGGLAAINMAAIFAARGVSQSYSIQAITPVLRTIGVVVLALTDQVSVLSVVAVSSAVSVVAFGASSWFVRGLGQLDAADARPTTRKELHRLTLTYTATISANAAQNEGEKVVLASYRPVAEVGEYQAAYRLIALSLVPLRAVTTIATRWALSAEERVGGQLRRTFRLSMVLSVYGILVGAGAILSRPLIGYVLGDEYVLVSTMFVWLCGFPLIRALANLPVLGLIGLNCNRERMYLGIFGAIVAVGCYVALVPTYGWRGGVIGTYVSETVTLVGGWWLLISRQRAADRAAVEADGWPAPKLSPRRS